MNAPRFCAALAILLGSLAFLGWHAVDGVGRTDSLLEADRVETGRNILELLNCVEDQVLDRVESGATVAVDPTMTDVLWIQRLPEFVFPHGRMTDDPSEADVVLSVQPDNGPGNCRGVTLVVSD